MTNLYPLPNAAIDPRIRRFVMPTRIVDQHAALGSITDSHNLLRNDLTCCTINSANTAPPYIILDFGQELSGALCIDVMDITPRQTAKIRIRFGESLSEVMTYPNNDHALHDITVEMPRLGRHEFGNTGFRFARIDILENRTQLSIRQIQAISLEQPYDYKGSFESSDPLLNDIWRVGARTVHLCCQDYILDGVKRDRLAWSGDIHPQLHVIAAVFGQQDDIIDRTMAFQRDSYPLPAWINGISSYTLWWIISLWDWYWFTGQIEILHSYADYLKELLPWLSKHIDDKGHEALTGGRFLDWAIALDEETIKPGLQSLFIWAAHCAQKCLEQIGQTELAQQYQALRDRLDPAAADQTDNPSVQSLRAHIAPEQAPQINQKYLSDKPWQGTSTWFAYYILNAKAIAGDITGALTMIRTYWGDMLTLGATTFWEHFDSDWTKNASRIDELPQPDKIDVHQTYGQHCYQSHRLSMCHGWAAGPTAWLTQYVLGVQPLEPGFKSVAVKPNLGDLSFARGTVPTPHGIIEVSHTRDAQGKITTDIKAPHTVTVVQ